MAKGMIPKKENEERKRKIMGGIHTIGKQEKKKRLMMIIRGENT